ncbi:hypothetical protein [Enterocloster asparagiformis]|nr:hypothetical protein [Enterocloster asparagiformis]
MSRACEELQRIMDQLADWQNRHGGCYVTEYEKEPQTEATVQDLWK